MTSSAATNNSAAWKSVRVTPSALMSASAPRSPFSPAASLVVGAHSLSSAASPARTEDVALRKLRIVGERDKQPTPVRVSSALAQRDFSQPAHRFEQSSGPPRASSALAHAVPVGVASARRAEMTGSLSLAKTRSVDSRAEAKPSDLSSSSSSLSGAASLPQYFGSTFAHLPNSKRLYIPTELPAHPTLPKTHSALVAADFQSVEGFMGNRTADGKILGNTTKRFVGDAHVPYFDHLAASDASSAAARTAVGVDCPVGPGNPFQAINDTWTKCWDNEAGAIYYYNNTTGEATWVKPDL